MADIDFFLTTKEARDFLAGLGLSLSVRTLEEWRTKGIGPAVRRVNSRVFYTESALRVWLDQTREEVVLEPRGEDE